MSASALASVLSRVSGSRVALVGGASTTVPSTADLEAIVAALEREADLICANGGGDVAAQLAAVTERIAQAMQRMLQREVGVATDSSVESSTARLESLVTLLPGGKPAPLSQTVQRIERALGTLLGQDVGTTPNGLDDAQLATRLEALTALLPGSAPAAAAAAPTPASAPVAVPAVVDNSAARAAEEAVAAAAALQQKQAAEEAQQKAAAAEAEAKKAADAKAAADAQAKKAADEAEAKKKADAAAAAAAAAKPAAAPVAAPAKVAPAPVVAAASPPASATVAASASSSATYTYEQLKGAVIPGVVWAEREQLLSDAEFLTVFKMDKAAFNALAGWKRADAKKKVNLF